jgi:hypothetical protein
MICDFEPVENEPGVFTCKVCKVKTPEGRTFEETDRVYRSCPADPIGPQKRKQLGIGPHEPTRRRSVSAHGVIPEEFEVELKEEFDVEPDQNQGLYSLYEQWGEAVKKWKEAGKPIRTKEEMQECFDICEKCPTDDFGSRMGLPYCKVCSCNVSTVSIGYLNKARMRTETCPKGHWPKVTCGCPVNAPLKNN